MAGDGVTLGSAISAGGGFTSVGAAFAQVQVLYEDEDLLVVVKPAGMPTAPLKLPASSADEPESLLEAVAGFCPAVLSVSGKKAVEGGLLHRIDTATTGLVLIAKTQKSYDFLSAEQNAGRFVKTYTAVCCEDCPLPGAPCGKPGVEVTSLFRPFGEGSRGVKPVFAESGMADRKKAGKKEYTTSLVSVTPLEKSWNGKKLFTVEARITAGYRHQVRAHLASIGLPVLGDPLYPFLWASASDAAREGGNPLPLYFYASGISVAQISVQLPESFLFPLPDRSFL